MGRKIVPLTVDLLDALGTQVPCRDCVFWEFDAVRRRAVEDRADAKDGWVSTVLRDWGSCGRVAMIDQRPVGLALYAPASLLPGADDYPTAPVPVDAVLLSTVYVLPDERAGGLGRMLIQGVARDLITRYRAVDRAAPALEAFGDAHGGDRCPGSSGGRVTGTGLPVRFLSSVGFKTQRAHPSTPRMRMELRAAVTWRDEVAQVVDSVAGAVRPRRRPVRARPTTRQSAAPVPRDAELPGPLGRGARDGC